MKRLIAPISILLFLLSFSLNSTSVRAEEKPTKSLHQAVIDNDAEQVRLNISAGANVNAKDTMGYTPLFYAAQNGKEDVAELLIAGGANVNVKDRTDNTPLHYAALGGHYDMCRLLLDEGADSGARNLMGVTPTAMAKAQGRSEIVELLSKHETSKLESESAEPTEIPKLSEVTEALFGAVNAGDANQVKTYLSRGADVNAKDRQTWTPLHVALWDGHKAIAEELIAKGADVNVKDKRGYTPLHLAAIKGRSDAAGLLIDKGANVNVKDLTEKTPLHLAADNGHKDMVELLITKGADVNAQAGNQNALSLARAKGHQEIVDLLLKHDAKEPTIDLMEDRLYGAATAIERQDLYPGDGGQLQRGSGQEGSLDILADPNEIKARIKTFEGLEKALAEIDSKSRLERGAWLQSKIDNRTSLARAVEEQVKGELTFVRKIAVEEKAEKTTKAIDDVLLKRQQRYEKVRRELLMQQKDLKDSTSIRGRSRTSRYPSRSTRGRYPPGQSPIDDTARPFDERDSVLSRPDRLRGGLDEPRTSLGGAETDKNISEWLQTTADNKNNLLKSVYGEITSEYISIRSIAVGEGAKKTTAAIDGILLDRQERFDDLTFKMGGERMGLPGQRGRYAPGQRSPQDRRLGERIPGEHLRGQELYFLEEENQRLRR